MEHTEPKGVLRRGVHDLWNHPMSVSMPLMILGAAVTVLGGYLGEWEVLTEHRDIQWVQNTGLASAGIGGTLFLGKFLWLVVGAAGK